MSNDAVRLSIGAQRRQIDGKNLYDSSWMNECTNNTEWEELFIERALEGYMVKRTKGIELRRL